MACARSTGSSSTRAKWARSSRTPVHFANLDKIRPVAVVADSAFVMFLVACDNAVFGDPKKGLVEKSCDTSGSAAAWAFVRG